MYFNFSFNLLARGLTWSNTIVRPVNPIVPELFHDLPSK